MGSMSIDVLLAILAFAAVVIAVLREAYDSAAKKLAVNRFGYATIIAGLIICCAMIYKADRDDNDRAKLNAEITSARNEILVATQREGSRLRPGDFQIRLLVDYRVKPTADMPRSVAISGTIGDIFFLGELINTNTTRRIRAGGRGLGYYGYRYYADNLTVGGLEKYFYSDNLNGEIFRVSFSADQFPPSGSEAHPMKRFSVDVYVQGRHFGVASYSEGEIETVLEFADVPVDSI